jgi:hypothetical protein
MGGRGRDKIRGQPLDKIRDQGRERMTDQVKEKMRGEGREKMTGRGRGKNEGAMCFLEKYAYAPVSQKLQKYLIFQIDTANYRCYTCR